MYYMKIKKVALILMSAFLCILSFASCSSVVDNKADTAEALDANLSPLASDPEFRNSIHLVRNSVTDTYTVVKGDGTIILNTMRPTDFLYLAKDEKTGEVAYILKQVTGETLEYHSYVDGYSGETYSYPDTKIETIFYNAKGEEIGLRAHTYGSATVVGKKIFYNDLSEPYGDNLYIYDVDTKKSEKAPHGMITYYGSHILLSTEAYGETEKKEILICDDDLNVVGTIDGYSYDGVNEYDGTKIATIMKNVGTKDNFVYKYNFLDENFNVIFDEPVDARPYANDKDIVTLHRGNEEFDYDFKEKKIVGDVRPYKGYDNVNDQYWQARKVYEPINDKIRSLDEKYTYVDTRIHDDKVLFFAHYSDEEVDYDDSAYQYKDHVDVYSITGELLSSYDHLNVAYEQEGYFLVDFDTIYDFDFNIVKTFDEKVYVERYEIGDLVYFSDRTDEHYNSRPRYNLYDSNFKTLYENVSSDSAYAFNEENYFVVADDVSTRIIDDKFNVIKEYPGRKFDIYDWYESVDYRIFTDIETDRMGIIDASYNIVVDNLKHVDDLEEKCFTYTNGFRYGLMDYNGKEILSLSIFNTMSEDAKSSDYDIRYVE